MPDLGIVHVKDEKELSKKILVPLLREMGYKSVQYVCGSDEFGRDIIFYELDKFNNQRWMGAQVKNIKIHGTSSKSKGNVQEIVNQIQEAFNNPFFDTSSNKEEYLKDMYVVTSKEITPIAKQSIKNKFRNQNVHFIDGQKLLELIKEYSPNLLFAEKKLDFIKIKILDYAKQYKGDLDGPILLGGELEDWHKCKSHLKLKKEEQEALCKIFSNNLFNFYHPYYGNQKIISWLDNFDSASKIISKHINFLIKRFPYYSDWGAKQGAESIFMGLKIIKKNAKKTYKKLIEEDIDTKMLITKLTKSINHLKYPYKMNIFMLILESDDILKDLFKDKKILFHFDKRSNLLLLISYEYFSDALKLLKKDKELINKLPEFITYYIEKVTNIIGFENFEFKFLEKFEKFIKFGIKNKIIDEKEVLNGLKENYQLILFVSLKRFKEAESLLKREGTYDSIGDEHLPVAFQRLFGNLEILLTLLNKTKYHTKNPVFLLELAEECYKNKKYKLSLKYANESFKKRKGFYSRNCGWRIEYVKNCQAENYFKLKNYKKCYDIYQKLTDEKKDIHWKEYEFCKKKLRLLS